MSDPGIAGVIDQALRKHDHLTKWKSEALSVRWLPDDTLIQTLCGIDASRVSMTDEAYNGEDEKIAVMLVGEVWRRGLVERYVEATKRSL